MSMLSADKLLSISGNYLLIRLALAVRLAMAASVKAKQWCLFLDRRFV